MRLWRRRTSTTHDVVIYTRRGCGLCRRAEQLAAREARGARVVHVDVDTDPGLVERYGVRVPVVLVDGVEVAELEVGPGQIRAALRRARRAAGGAGRALGGPGRPS